MYSKLVRLSSKQLTLITFYCLLLTASCLLLTSCGIKAPPLSPEEFAPEKITDLEAYAKDNEIILKWTIPARRVDDTKLLDLAGFEVYRKEQGDPEEETYVSLYHSALANKQIEYLQETEEEAGKLINTLDEPEPPAGEYPEEIKNIDENDAPGGDNEGPADFIKLPSYQERSGGQDLAGYERIDQLLVDRLEDVKLEEDYIIYKDKGLSEAPEGIKSNKGYSYLVISFDKSDLPGKPSNIAQVWLSPTPKPPTNLLATRGEGKVWLSWSSPVERVDRTPLTELQGFNLYRKGARDSDYSFYPLNGGLIKENAYIDTEVTIGETYVYLVRAVTTNAPPWHEGPVSNEVAVTLWDTYSPQAPQGLVGISKKDAIVLNWNPNSEPDLLGYHLYRKRASENNYQRVTAVPISETTFRDKDIDPNQLYFYKITALDKASPANESPFSQEIQVFPIKKE